MAGVSMRRLQPATRPMFPRRCSMAAGRAATMAAGAAPGADLGDRMFEIGHQGLLEFLMPNPDPPTSGTSVVSTSWYLPNFRLLHDYPRADADAAVKVFDVLVEHTDA